MPRLVSTETMVQQLEGLLDTNDLSHWEAAFVLTMKHRRIQRALTRLTERQVERLDELYRKHFA